ncbi:MAG: hypothetical protein ABI748_01400, partial [Dokdonella sp.]
LKNVGDFYMGHEMRQFAIGKPSISEQINRLVERRDVLILYIDECRKKQDWHGVRDAATDIEVCLAELGAYETVQRALDSERLLPLTGRRGASSPIETPNSPLHTTIY